MIIVTALITFILAVTVPPDLEWMPVMTGIATGLLFLIEVTECRHNARPVRFPDRHHMSTPTPIRKDPRP